MLFVTYTYIYTLLYLAVIYNQGTFLFSVCYYVSYAICINFHGKKKKLVIPQMFPHVGRKASS